jgi:cytochrome P450
MATSQQELTEPLLDDSFFATEPWEHFARLRSLHPVARHEDPGFWVLSRHADVVAASADAGTFCSGQGILLFEIGVEYPTPPTMMHTDAPAHSRYRKLVQPGFAPRVIRALEPVVRTRAAAAVDRIPVAEPADVVETVTAGFPLQIIADLLGIGDADQARFLRWSDAAIPGAGEFTPEERAAELAAMNEFLVTTAASRRGKDGDDLVTVLANVDVDGERLSDDELAMFLVQLLVAGNETSRNMLSGGLHALATHPAQWAALRADPSLVPGAVEEMLRWTTPVIYFMRTATRDTQIDGIEIAAGDPVVLLYASANRDEAEFGPTADRFDITRSPNHHVAFGFGPHFCIGAALARLEARALLEDLLGRFATVEAAGPIERTASMVIAGIRRAPLRFSP